MMKRRVFLKLLTASGAASITGCQLWPDEGIWNPCLTGGLPEKLANHELMAVAWDGIDTTLFRDVHCHLIGTGDGNHGIWINPKMHSFSHPILHTQLTFYLNGSCTTQGKQVDKNYAKRLTELLKDFPAGAKAMLLAFEHYHDDNGKKNIDASAFYTPNNYAALTADSNRNRFEWIASIHPYKEDAVFQLRQAIKGGAKAIKWLPPAMNINPASKKCDAFYQEMIKANIPLLTHGGDEHAVDAGELQKLGNPLLLRYPLDQGVRVIVAHCATIGVNIDIDKKGSSTEIENYRLFSRLMNEKKYENILFADISAITQINRSQETLESIVSNKDWHHRLVYGSDYPLPGVMPLFSPRTMLDRGYISKEVAEFVSEVRQYNPILFDFLLKRLISIKGNMFSNQVFEAARII